MKIKCLDLFAGVGGFRYSFETVCNKLNLEPVCVGFSEIDKYAIETYKANFKKNERELGDIEKINEKELDDFDILFAGFPCQPFSLMGEQKGFADSRGTLFFHIERILKEKKPKMFLLENVRRLLTHNNQETYNSIIKILENKLGYYTKTFMLNSSEHGVPQIRRRVYIIGSFDKNKIDKIKEPKPSLKNKKLTSWHILEKNVDKKYYLSDKMKKIILSNGSGNFRSKSEINQLIARPLTATMHKMHRACQDNYFSDDYILGKFDKKKNVIKKNKDGSDKIRRITPLEAFRLQGYPDNFVHNAKKKNISDSQLYRQAGNSITVTVVQKIIHEMLNT